jgi:glutamate-1-semialdehyde 2,1-aminomutase
MTPLDAVRDTYCQRTRGSAEAFRSAREVIPGGISRAGIAFVPHPVVLSHAQGCRVVDVDGNVYVDFLNNHGSLVHGHAHTAITRAIQEQAERGTAWSAISQQEATLARMLCERVASIERVRFCNSGTEAGMQALRIVRGFSGKDRILKFEGGMHGSADDLEVSKRIANLAVAGPDDDPVAVPGPGFASGSGDRVLVAPFNAPEVVERRIRDHRDELAAVFVEPVMSYAGQVTPEPNFLPFLRQVTRENGVLLVADEVVTLRLACGGAQALYDLDPDLTMLGKLIGGGLPVGAVGGRADLMAVSSYVGDGQGPRLSLSGTFSGAAVVMAAGAASLDALDADTIERINSLGDRLRAGLRAACQDVGVLAQVTGIGSMLHVHFTDQPVRDYRGAATGSYAVMQAVFLALLNRGIHPSPQGWFNISTPMTNAEIDAAIEAFRESLVELKSWIVETAPGLIRTQC